MKKEFIAFIKEEILLKDIALGVRSLRYTFEIVLCQPNCYGIGVESNYHIFNYVVCSLSMGFEVALQLLH